MQMHVVIEKLRRPAATLEEGIQSSSGLQRMTQTEFIRDLEHHGSLGLHHPHKLSNIGSGDLFGGLMLKHNVRIDEIEEIVSKQAQTVVLIEEKHARRRIPRSQPDHLLRNVDPVDFGKVEPQSPGKPADPTAEI